jgi:hypothetical protein
MGCCCSCLKKKSNASLGRETEMQAKGGQSSSSNEGTNLSVSRAMSAPSIDVQDQTKVSGYGLALANVTIEQDSAYWEAHIEIAGAEEVGKSGTSFDVLFGVATKKSQKFYQAHAEAEETNAGTDLMRKIKVKNGDTVGVAVQQSDLPMVQFLLNGEPLHNANINRFRGAVYPSVFLPEDNTEGALTVRLVFNESQFKELPPNVRFGPVIVARAIV